MYHLTNTTGLRVRVPRAAQPSVAGRWQLFWASLVSVPAAETRGACSEVGMLHSFIHLALMRSRVGARAQGLLTTRQPTGQTLPALQKPPVRMWQFQDLESLCQMYQGRGSAESSGVLCQVLGHRNESTWPLTLGNHLRALLQ